MKKTMRVLCAILIVSLVLVIPAQAEATAEPRESIFFSSYCTYLYKTSSTSFQIWFEVDSNAAMMDELGASIIELYRSPDGQNWTKIKTYTKEEYPTMIDTDAYYYVGHLDYTSAWPGYYYTARVTFYARDSRGFGEREFYTDILQM